MTEDRGSVTFLRRQAAARPFLVCVRAGAQSRHHDWFQADQPRNWDFMISYYEMPPGGMDDRAEIVIAGGWSKMSAVKAAHEAAPDLFAAYTAIFFPDDDIVIELASIDRLFSIFQQIALDLAQPALTHDSFHSWDVTLACPSFHLRFTNFVEIMMPVFSRAAFMACVDSFDATISGYGLDFLWPQLLGRPRDRIAVIDAVMATHTRPIDQDGGRFYLYLKSIGRDPYDEWEELFARYGVEKIRPEVTGVVTETSRGTIRAIFDRRPAPP